MTQHFQRDTRESFSDSAGEVFCSAVGILGLKGKSWRKGAGTGEAVKEFWRN